MSDNVNPVFRAHTGLVGTTPVTLTEILGDGTSPFCLLQGALIKAHKDNVGTIVIGHTPELTIDSLDSGNNDGFPLEASENINVTAANTDMIFLLASAEDQHVNVIMS